MKPVVLLLSTYPITMPRHGGQIRTSNIAKVYTDKGWQVESMAVYEPEGCKGEIVGPRDIPFLSTSAYRKYKARDVPLINDLLTGSFATAGDGGFPSIQKKLPKRIDAIHVEQPWLWPLACKVKELHDFKDICLVYGSQNIEAPLKREILENYEVTDIDDVIAEIEELEHQAARDADFTIAVTQSDLDTLIKWGAKRPLLACNGIAPWFASQKTISHWQGRLPKAPWILYVASAHPPNFTGFIQCIGNSLGCIPPDSRLVVAGSVCDHLYEQLALTRWNSLNLSRLELLGVLTDDDLAAVKNLAHAFLLPIPHGGGSNIKTAEALFSGAYVVGTKSAFRGFETFLDLPEVTIANSPSEFQKTIRETLLKPPLSSEESKANRAELQWDRCLAPIPDLVRTVLKGAQLQ